MSDKNLCEYVKIFNKMYEDDVLFLESFPNNENSEYLIKEFIQNNCEEPEFITSGEIYFSEKEWEKFDNYIKDKEWWGERKRIYELIEDRDWFFNLLKEYFLNSYYYIDFIYRWYGPWRDYEYAIKVYPEIKERNEYELYSKFSEFLYNKDKDKIAKIVLEYFIDVYEDFIYEEIEPNISEFVDDTEILIWNNNDYQGVFLIRNNKDIIKKYNLPYPRTYKNFEEFEWLLEKEISDFYRE